MASAVRREFAFTKTHCVMDTSTVWTEATRRANTHLWTTVRRFTLIQFQKMFETLYNDYDNSCVTCSCGWIYKVQEENLFECSSIWNCNNSVIYSAIYNINSNCPQSQRVGTDSEHQVGHEVGAGTKSARLRTQLPETCFLLSRLKFSCCPGIYFCCYI